MRAVQFEQFGAYDQLKLVDVPEPMPSRGRGPRRHEGRRGESVRQHAAAGSRGGVEPPLQQGNEGCGIVVGQGTDALPAGTRVMVVGTYGYTRPGTWAEYVTASPSEAVRATPTT